MAENGNFWVGSKVRLPPDLQRWLTSGGTDGGAL